MVERQKTFSLISSRDHCQRFSPSQIPNTPHADLNLRRTYVQTLLNEILHQWQPLHHGTTIMNREKDDYLLLLRGISKTKIVSFRPIESNNSKQAALQLQTTYLIFAIPNLFAVTIKRFEIRCSFMQKRNPIECIPSPTLRNPFTLYC